MQSAEHVGGVKKQSAWKRVSDILSSALPTMDYRGQKLSENIYYFLTILFGAIAWIAGYIQGDFTITVYGWFIGLAISLVLCIPDWPMYNRDHVTWLEEIGQSNRSSATPTATVDSKSKSKSN